MKYKRFLSLVLILALLCACTPEKPDTAIPAETAAPADTPAPVSVSVSLTEEPEEPEERSFDPDEYLGFYTNDSYDTVTIEKENGGYWMAVELYRLTGLDEGTVSVFADGVDFHATDAAGNPIFLSFYRDGEQYVLRVVESTWPLLEQGTVIGNFYRTTLEEYAAEVSANPDAQATLPERGDLIDPEDLQYVLQSHYTFKPLVCSVYMEEVFGKDMCDAWANLVNAVMAGENTFACKDQHTYDWVMGQFPERCFPILKELIDYAYDREHSVIDGVASFTWLVPPEEAAKKIEEFGTMIEDLLNKVLLDDYTDLEKALALYEYFANTYEYDYDTYYKMYETYVDYTSTYRFLMTGVGICHEISSAYSYLLMQAGVEATIMMGYDHQWSYVRINGNNYHIDPTFVLSDKSSLAYFMMTDEQRGATGYDKSSYTITSNYAQDYPHPDYVAEDDTFAPLWDKPFETFFHDTHTILCWVETGDYGEWTYFYFDYAGY